MTATLVLTALACGDSATEPRDVAGSYELQSVNGQLLPITLSQTTGYRLEVTAATLDLSSNGTYTLTTVFRETVNGNPSTDVDVETGTFTTSGSTVTLRDQQGFASNATLTGNQLVIQESGFVLVFVRTG